MRNLRTIEKLEQAKGVRNERVWFDRGSGRSFDHDGLK
jgi:hypothetical protein